MPPAPPPNSATQSSLRPINIHIVDEFNLDTSLDVASTILASPHCASCNQIRISSSGIHPQLNAHPKLLSSDESNKNTAKSTTNKSKSKKAANATTTTATKNLEFQYGSTTFEELAPILEWDDERLKRNQLMGSGPQKFSSLDRKVRSSSSNNNNKFDLVLCCSKPVYDVLSQYYASSSFDGGKTTNNQKQNSAISAGNPHTLFIIYIDPKFYNHAATTTSNKPTQGLLFTSLVVELLDLIHLRVVKKEVTAESEDAAAASQGNNNNDDDEGLVPQHVVNGLGEKWKEDFSRTLKQFEQLRRVEVLFRPFVI